VDERRTLVELCLSSDVTADEAKKTVLYATFIAFMSSRLETASKFALGSIVVR
jgi:hypothetical protein